MLMHLCIELQVLNNSLTTDEAQAQVAELTKAVSFSLLICCLIIFMLSYYSLLHDIIKERMRGG